MATEPHSPASGASGCSVKEDVRRRSPRRPGRPGPARGDLQDTATGLGQATLPRGHARCGPHPRSCRQLGWGVPACGPMPSTHRPRLRQHRTFNYVVHSRLDTPARSLSGASPSSTLDKGPVRQHAVQYAETGYSTTWSGIVPHGGVLYNSMPSRVPGLSAREPTACHQR